MTKEIDTDRRMLIAFLAIAFSLTWGIAAVLIVFTAQVEAVFGPISYTNPLFILAVYSPGIAAVVLVTRRYGLRGLGAFFSRLTLWRMAPGWWLFLVAAIPAMFYLGALIAGRHIAPTGFASWLAIAPALLLTLFIGPIEELGWRGLALPLLQRRMAPIWSGLVLGVIWALWHVPAFLLSGAPQSSWSFPAFFFGVVALSVIITPMFNAAGGSILVAVLFHFQVNGPLWPDAQPWDTILFAVVALVVVWWNRHTMFDRKAGATQLL